MKKLFLTVLVAAFVGGCATASVTEDEMQALTNRVAQLERELSAASGAASTAQAAQRDAASARSIAERAMSAAEAANEKIDRVSSTCCARK